MQSVLVALVFEVLVCRASVQSVLVALVFEVLVCRAQCAERTCCTGV